MASDIAGEAHGGGEVPSPFRAAFGRARIEALGATSLPLPDDRVNGPLRRFEYRVERRTGKRRRDARAWNALGRSGWELVAITGRHAHFKRELV